MARVLVIEDDEALSVALQEGFASEGFEVRVARDGDAGLRAAREEAVDLVILDVMLPRRSGLEVCRELRARGSAVPILMLTARGQEIDKVVGLRTGADDYLTKPFGFMELIARCEALLRRSGGGRRSSPLKLGDLTVDFRRHEAWRGDGKVELSAREYRLLACFAGRRGQVVTRESLLEAVWDYRSTTLTRTVDMHIAKLRKKIEPDSAAPRWLLTVHGLGYKLAED